MRAISLSGFATGVIAIVAMTAPTFVAQQSSTSRVTVQDLRDGFKDPTRWLTYSGDYTGTRHSPLTEINPSNVDRLTAQWTFQVDEPALFRGLGSVPLAVNGVLYFAGTYNQVFAIDPRSGRQIWRYTRALPADDRFPSTSCCSLTRGLAILGDKLFLGTLDAHLIALDIRTGKPVWDTVIEDYRKGFATTSAPLVIGDKVVVGLGGGDRANRCFLDAYDVQTGKRAWRFYTTPEPGEPGSETWSSVEAMAHGGGATWSTGSYDPILNVVYWGTGNAYGGGDARKGDNLYTASIVALDGDTGKLRWHYQTVPHDIHDYDAAVIPVLIDTTVDGQRRKLVLFAPKNGYLYVLDRIDGRFVAAHALVEAAKNWATITASGRPTLGRDDGTNCFPDFHGGTNFWPPSYDGERQLYFVTVHETCMIFNPTRPGQLVAAPGSWNVGGAGYAALRALDPISGARRWEYRYPPSDFGLTGVSQSRANHGIGLAGGVMSTASGLVFTGDNQGNFIAFDARVGKPLWHYQTGAPLWGSAPMTYVLDGKQHVLVSSGLALMDFSLPDGIR